MDDRALLRDLKAAIERTEGHNVSERNEAVHAVLRDHGATTDDVARLLRRARQQHRVELRGLARRIDQLIMTREDMVKTVEAVERYLRGDPGA